MINAFTAGWQLALLQALRSGWTIIILITVSLLLCWFAGRHAFAVWWLQGMESTIASLPNQRDLHQLQLEMSNLRGELRELGPSIRQVSRISDLLLENELKEKNT